MRCEPITVKLYGTQASGETQLSSTMRAINNDSDMKNAVEKRLSRNVANEDIGAEIDKAILAEGAKHVRDDSLILVDPTEIRNEFGLCLEHVTLVRDASHSSSSIRNQSQPKTSYWNSVRDPGNCSQQTFAEVGVMRSAKLLKFCGAGMRPAEGSPRGRKRQRKSHTARDSFATEKTSISLAKAHITFYLSV